MLSLNSLIKGDISQLCLRCRRGQTKRDNAKSHNVNVTKLVFKESALGRFFHRVAMSVFLYIYIYMSLFHVIFFRGIRQALACNKTGPSIGHASILLHAWSPQNGGWVQSVLFAWNKTGSCVE